MHAERAASAFTNRRDLRRRAAHWR